MTNPTRMIAVLPTNDIHASIKFYELLGFKPKGSDVYDGYQVLIDGKGSELHLTVAPEDWLIPGKSPCGVYWYADNVDELAVVASKYALHPPRKTSWGTYEFALSDPDENLIRVGRILVD
ncbi:VOC family protein [Paenochrobactrum pullorum]|uniref:VOC family protein n=1 Tax=Paenochrobactrum pullorum TaxID=1324351 RepID=UPI0035BC5558